MAGQGANAGLVNPYACHDAPRLEKRTASEAARLCKVRCPPWTRVRNRSGRLPILPSDAATEACQTNQRLEVASRYRR